MSYTEADGRKWLRRLLEPRGVLVQQIETGSVASGVPDVYIRTFSVSAWCELKVGFFAHEALCFKWRPLQRAWLSRHNTLSGRSLLFAFFEEFGQMCLTVFMGDRICENYAVSRVKMMSVLCARLEDISASRLLQVIDEGRDPER